MFQPQKSHRALIIGSSELRDELHSILSDYGYFVEHCTTRVDGVRRFRQQKQAIVIVDIQTLRGFRERLFRFIRMVRENAIVLVVAESSDRREAARLLTWGAHDILEPPLKSEVLNATLERTYAYHSSLIRATFIRHAVLFGLLMLPLWIALLFVLWH